MKIVKLPFYEFPSKWVAIFKRDLAILTKKSKYDWKIDFEPDQVNS